MILHDISPVIFSIGELQIRWYGLVYALGFLFCYYIFRKISDLNIIKNSKGEYFSREDVEMSIIYAFASMLIFSRLFMFTFFKYTMNVPWTHFFNVWEGGMSFHGAFVGVLIGVWFFCYKRKFSFLELVDIGVIIAAIFLGLGRLMNYVNAELYGKVTNSSFCIKYDGIDGCRYPYQFFESWKNLFIAVILVIIFNKKYNLIKMEKRMKDGLLFFAFLFLYGFLRFFLDFYRDEPLFYGLNMGQWLCIPMVIIGGFFLVLYKKDIKNVFNF